MSLSNKILIHGRKSEKEEEALLMGEALVSTELVPCLSI